MKFLHLADLHLDSVLRPGLPAARPELLARATLDAFEAAIDFAVRDRVDGVLLAGDLYDRKDRSLRARLHLRRQLERLDERGIAAFLVHGNHDPLVADDAAVPLPPNAHVFGASWGEVDGPLGRYRVQGISYPRPDVSDNLAKAFRRTSAAPSIGLLHTNVGGREGHANYAPCSVDDLAAAGLDYWALGHVHTTSTFVAGPGLAGYPGTPQGRHAREPGPRGGLLVEVDEGARPRARFLAFDVARWHTVRVDVGSASSLDEVEAAVVAAVGRGSEGEEGRTHLHRVVLTGVTPLHAELRRPETQQTLELTLAERLERQGAVLDSLECETGVVRDLAALLASGGLVADVARWLGEPLPQAELDELWAAAGLDLLDAQLAGARVEGLERRSILAAAVERALDQLTEAG